MDPKLKALGLPWSSAALLSRLAREPPAGHPPALFPACVAVAVEMRRRYGWKQAALILVQHGAWLRPGEATELRGGDVSLPENA